MTAQDLPSPDSPRAYDLYKNLMDYSGTRAYADVICPWLNALDGSYRTWLTAATTCSGWWTQTDDYHVFLGWELYALGRVTDTLLLGRQPRGPEGVLPWLALSDDEYVGFFASLGMTTFCGNKFEAFRHEIVEVEQHDDPDEPITVTEIMWPGLMLGDLLFYRAGVRVRAGRHHAERGVADRSPLYWTYRRNHRPTVDLSHGWGSNSQWSTDLRLDYRTTDGDRLNVGVNRRIPIDGKPSPRWRWCKPKPGDLSPEEHLLTASERRELLRHRCLLRAPVNATELTVTDRWEHEFFPFNWQLPATEE